MDSSMDIETDSTDEVLINYLKGKIDEVKILSELAKKDLIEAKKRHEECLDLLKNSEKFNTSDIDIKKHWQRVYNNKWIIGVNVENLTNSPAKNINIILKWDIKQDLQYLTKIYTKYKSQKCDKIDKLINKSKVNSNLENLLEFFSDELSNTSTSFKDDEYILTEDLINNSIIIIIIEIPEFLQFNKIEIKGILTYEKNDEKHQTTLENFCLNTNDIISNKYEIKMADLISGCEEEFLSVFSTGICTSVKFIIPTGIYRTQEGILQLDCNFTKIDIPSRDIILIFDGSGESLKFCMIKFLPGQNEIHLITKDYNQLYLLYHHLYTNIPGVILLDQNSEQINDNPGFLTRQTQNFLEPLVPNQDNLIELIESFDRQLIYIENTFKDCNADSDDSKKIDVTNADGDYKNFRKKLSHSEKSTDEILVKVFEKRNE